MRAVRVGDRWIGDGWPAYIVAEIGINHNGDVRTAKKLIDASVQAGCDAVKLQKRNPLACVPLAQREAMRETPWGYMTYLEYRQRVEFDRDQYWEIAQYCFEKNIAWTASCWDESSVDFMEEFNPPFYKIASAALTDLDLLRRHLDTGRSLVLSTGMSTTRFAPDAIIYKDGDIHEMIGKCDVLVSGYSTVTLTAAALGKEIHSTVDPEQLKRLVPVQNGGTSAARIAEVSRSLLARNPDLGLKNDLCISRAILCAS